MFLSLPLGHCTRFHPNCTEIQFCSYMRDSVYTLVEGDVAKQLGQAFIESCLVYKGTSSLVRDRLMKLEVKNRQIV